MNLSAYKSNLNEKLSQNRVLWIIVILIGFTSLYNAVMIQKALNSHRTIIIPAVLNSKIELTGDKASPDLIKEYTRYACALAFNYTPSTARTQLDELLVLYTPESFPEAKKNYYGMADNIEMAKLTGAFYIQKIDFDEANKTIHITGEKRMYKDDVKVEDGLAKIAIEYRFNNGRFMIHKIYPEGDTHA